MSEKKGKVVITILGEQKLTKIKDGENTLLPICGKSYTVSEKTATFLITNKYGKRCEISKAKK